MKLKIIWASMFGNAEYVAEKVEHMAMEKNFDVELIEMNDVTMGSLEKMENVAIVTSTTGQGDLPTNGEIFWDELKKTNVDLSKMKYSVCALGDSSHAEFCGAGVKINDRLKELGANRILDMQECDGDDRDAPKWATKFLETLEA